ncbi:MAG TPA: acyl-CoA dehydrogenase family protein [Acidimicrobiales bacterium]|nr:acyl-CoA dehydrogenase family protein [Acidimicrobiales bacterium]
MTAVLPDVATFRAECRDWLAARLKPRPAATMTATLPWGVGSDDVSVFHDLSPGAERDLLDQAMKWQQVKCDAGYGALTWPVEYGGAGLPAAYEEVFNHEEAAFDTPAQHETFSVTVRLVAPTINLLGTDRLRERFVRRFVRAEDLCCQLFSEPGAGSDLASLGTRAVRDGDEWVINGQKVWSSGARFSAWGELIARTDPNVPKHAGLTAFIIPMDSPGLEVRPIRQMSGGSSFNEVFFTDVHVPDELRLGEVGAGWKVALTTLGFERAGGGTRTVGGSWQEVAMLARWLDRTGEPLVRQRVADLYINRRITQLLREGRAARAAAGQPPGPEGSIGKLRWSQDLTRTSEVVSYLLGPRLTADTGEWGTYSWTAQVLGAPGYRIAGGSDEIQRNIIGERVLGLPPEPRSDRRMAWRDVPR